MQIIDLLTSMADANASDLFVNVGKEPVMRIYGELKDTEHVATTEEELEAFFAEHFPAGTLDRIRPARDMDVGLSLTAVERFRLNVYFQKGKMGVVARRVPLGNIEFSEYSLPKAIESLADSERGLIIISGATGSGKSTTMAAMLHHINKTRSKHIVTIEDPIEFVHQDEQCVVTQREIGNDTMDFASSLKHVVRQSPDVIFVGELRDVESLQVVLSAAMTGHLVITTMHTTDAVQTMERLVNLFPDHLRSQVAGDLALSLRGVVSQRLVPVAAGKGMVPAMEILVGTALVRQHISARFFEGLSEAMKTGAEGMQTYTQSLLELYSQGRISLEVGAGAATNRDEFTLAAQGMETGADSLRVQEGAQAEALSMKALLKAAIRHAASDLLITTHSPPKLRIHGALCDLKLPELTGVDTQRLLFSILSPSQRVKFETQREIDLGMSVSLGEKDHRFRVNGFYQKGSVGTAIRVINEVIPQAADLGLPPAVIDLANRSSGLVLVTGPTGHGKSTTLACLIDQINQSRSCHIITIEDPIEFVHMNHQAVVEQREILSDTLGFTQALKYVLRQDPDVILIGEMRDHETISAALTAAETGHLVLATLHTNDCPNTIDRIVDSFPAHQQPQIKSQLANCLQGVVAQRLLPTIDGAGRVAAFEIMLGNAAVRSMIRDGRTHQLLSTIETCAKDGMVTMERAMQNLYNHNLVSRETLKGFGVRIAGV